MTRRINYTQDEWLTLAKTPVHVALAVMGIGPTSPFQIAQETIGMGRALRQANAEHAATELVGALVEETNAQAAELFQTQAESVDLAQAGEQAIAACARVAAILKAKATAEEADEYRRWVLWLGRNVAASAIEQVGTRVSAEESALLQRIAETLGHQSQSEAA